MTSLHPIVRSLARLLLVLGGVVVGAAVLVLAATAGAGLLLWARLTSRRPAVQFGVPGWATMGQPGFAPGAHRAAGRAQAPGDVIDVEAREVPEALESKR